MITIYLVGSPGVGKTTLARAMLGCDKFNRLSWESYFSISPKWTFTKHVQAAGHYKGETFDGADRIPATRWEHAIEAWASRFADDPKRPITILDGDRFSHAKAYEVVARKSRTIIGVHLATSEDTLAKHRAARGSKQNETWMKGRATKAAKFSAFLTEHSHPVMTFDPAIETPEFCIKELQRWYPARLAGLGHSGNR